MIQAAILAGGLGTRLLPLTGRLPKALAPVAGRPFLFHQLQLLRDNGIRRVVLLTGHLGEQIEEVVGDGSALGMDIVFSREPEPLGTGGALRHAASLLEERFLLFNGDTYHDIDLAALVRGHDPDRELARIVAYTNPEHTVPNNLTLETGGCVTRYDKRKPDAATHVDAGTILLERGALREVSGAGHCSLEEEVYPRLIEAGTMYAYEVDSPYFDIGSFAVLRSVQTGFR
jgi:NDP-sugar pyrophosphorylase family protein